MRSVLSRLSDASATSSDVCGPAVQTGLLAAFELEAELRRNRHAVADRREGLADELLVREGPVRFGGIEEGDPAFNRRADDRDPLLPSSRRAVAEADSHAAKAERRHFQATLSQQTFLHDFTSLPGSIAPFITRSISWGRYRRTGAVPALATSCQHVCLVDGLLDLL